MLESFFTSDALLTFDMNIYKFSETLWLEGTPGRIMDTFWIFMTHLGGNGLFFCILLCLFKKTRKAGLACIAALAFVSLLNNNILKDIFDRARPYIMDSANWERISSGGWEYSMPFERLSEKSTSFPSGHTATSFAIASGILYVDKKKGIFPLLIAFLIGFSRIYIHVHYPSDVIGGAVIGLVFGFITCLILFRGFGKKLDKLNEKCGYRLFYDNKEQTSACEENEET